MLSSTQGVPVSVKKTELVVKSNRLVEASYRLGMVEQQIILYSMAKGREDDLLITADTAVTVDAKDFAAMFGTNPTKVYQQLKDAMNALYERSVTIRETDDATGKEKVTKTRWISTASYVDGAGKIQVIFAPRVIPFITRPTVEFTRYRIEKIGRMSSAYAVRLYELLVQYLPVGKRELEIAWLREALQIANDEYPRIVDFKLRVIDVAVKQITDLSDLVVSYEQRKTGRAVTHLVFSIKGKAEVKAKAKPKKEKIDKAYVEKHAKPGESYDQAFRRLLEERGQQRLVA